MTGRPYRFHRVTRWNQAFDEAPESVKQAISNILAILAENPEPRDDSILRITEAKGVPSVGPVLIAGLGDVLMTFVWPVPTYPTYIILLSMVWFEQETDDESPPEH